ncbi:zf-TFIIB domain-containing protein [Nocardioides sp. SR21]|uniref:zf-TFIIB domain-containing protein n=1 Tax=Nocardioides sp. SR21 TaxID=2919501 RepID=UPI001FAA9F1B|nr:zf-TFIIB domain-containing protein [Nocardioides sp. SR21]
METLTCPVCSAEMVTRAIAAAVGEGGISQCPAGHGVFLARAELGDLIEAENDWHRHAGQHTAPMPRITADMTAPPAAKAPPRAWVETLFE